jgi:hypothetical protein
MVAAVLGNEICDVWNQDRYDVGVFGGVHDLKRLIRFCDAEFWFCIRARL